MKKSRQTIYPEREKVFESIREFILQREIIPTLDELSAHLNIAKSVVRLRVQELANEGLLVWTPHKARTIRLVANVEPKTTRVEPLGQE